MRKTLIALFVGMLVILTAAPAEAMVAPQLPGTSPERPDPDPDPNPGPIPIPRDLCVMSRCVYVPNPTVPTVPEVPPVPPIPIFPVVSCDESRNTVECASLANMVTEACHRYLYSCTFSAPPLSPPVEIPGNGLPGIPGVPGVPDYCKITRMNAPCSGSEPVGGDDPPPGGERPCYPKGVSNIEPICLDDPPIVGDPPPEPPTTGELIDQFDEVMEQVNEVLPGVPGTACFSEETGKLAFAITDVLSTPTGNWYQLFADTGKGIYVSYSISSTTMSPTTWLFGMEHQYASGGGYYPIWEDNIATCKFYTVHNEGGPFTYYIDAGAISETVTHECSIAWHWDVGVGVLFGPKGVSEGSWEAGFGRSGTCTDGTVIQSQSLIRTHDSASVP